MRRLPQRCKRTATRVPFTTLFREPATRRARAHADGAHAGCRRNGGRRRADDDRRPRILRPLLRLHGGCDGRLGSAGTVRETPPARAGGERAWRSEEHTSELQSLMRISYAVFCLNKKTKSEPP